MTQRHIVDRMESCGNDICLNKRYQNKTMKTVKMERRCKNTLTIKQYVWSMHRMRREIKLLLDKHKNHVTTTTHIKPLENRLHSLRTAMLENEKFKLRRAKTPAQNCRRIWKHSAYVQDQHKQTRVHGEIRWARNAWHEMGWCRCGEAVRRMHRDGAKWCGHSKKGRRGRCWPWRLCVHALFTWGSRIVGSILLNGCIWLRAGNVGSG